jgi:hypothetical protein
MKRGLTARHYTSTKYERLQLLYFESVTIKTEREICHAVRKVQAPTPSP